MKKIFWVFLVVLFFSFTFAAAGEQPNFDGTIALIVSGDYQTKLEVQQALQQVLQGRGYNVVLPNYKQESPYRLLEVNVDRQSGQTESNQFRVGNYSSYTYIHNDIITVKITLYLNSGYNALPISTGLATLPVRWSEGNSSYYGERWNTSGQSSGEKELKKKAIEVALRALNQIQLSSAVPKTITAPVDLNFDLSSFLEMVRDRGEYLKIFMEVKNGLIVLRIATKEDGYKIGKTGVGRTLDEAFRDLMK